MQIIEKECYHIKGIPISLCFLMLALQQLRDLIIFGSCCVLFLVDLVQLLLFMSVTAQDELKKKIEKHQEHKESI